MKKKLGNLIVGLVLSGALAVLVFADVKFLTYLLCSVFIFGAFVGFGQAWSVSSKELATNGFRWDFYIPALVNIIILFTAGWPIAWVFLSFVLIILIVKNILGIRSGLYGKKT